MGSLGFIDWTEYAGKSDEELRELFSDEDIARIHRQKLIMYIYYRNLAVYGEADFWEVFGDVRNGLVEKYGEDAVLALEESALVTRYELEDINRVFPEAKKLFNADVLDEQSKKELQMAANRLRVTGSEMAAVGLAAMADEEALGDFERKENETREACAARNYDRMADKLIHKDDPTSEETVTRMRRCSMAHVKTILTEGEKGHIDKMVKTMKAGIRKTGERFADARDADEAATHAVNLREMLGFVEERPELFEACHFEQEELEAAHGAVIMGEIILKGLNAKAKYQEAALSGKELSQKEKEEYWGDILQMSVVLNDKERQMAVFKEQPEKKMPPTKMQYFFGQKTNIKDIRKGKMSETAASNKAVIKKSNVFKNVVKTNTFNGASLMSDKNKFLTIGRQTITEIVTTGDKIALERAVKDLKTVSADKEKAAKKEGQKGIAKKEPSKKETEKKKDIPQLKPKSLESPTLTNKNQ